MRIADHRLRSASATVKLECLYLLHRIQFTLRGNAISTTSPSHFPSSSSSPANESTLLGSILQQSASITCDHPIASDALHCVRQCPSQTFLASTTPTSLTSLSALLVCKLFFLPLVSSIDAGLAATIPLSSLLKPQEPLTNGCLTSKTP